MAEQIQAITGKRIRRGRGMRSMIETQAPQLPEVYAQREARETQEQQAGMRARELTLAEETAETQQEQVQRSTILGTTATGAMIGAQSLNPYGVAIGAGVGFVAGLASTFF